MLKADKKGIFMINTLTLIRLVLRLHSTDDSLGGNFLSSQLDRNTLSSVRFERKQS